MKTILKWGTLLVSTGLIMLSCRVTSDEGGRASTLESAKFENGEISGWNCDEATYPKGFVKFSAANMVQLVNGGAAEYADKGLTEGFCQEMIKGEQTYRSWVMDFGTEANAKELYNTKLQQYASVKEAAGSYQETKAFVKSSQYGYDGFAVFGKYIVLLWLDGFGTNKSEAKERTVEFLQTIEQKIKELGLL